MKTSKFQIICGCLFYWLSIDLVMGEPRTSIVLGTEDWPPFSYADDANKQFFGLSTEVIYATFKRMNITIKKNRVYPWARAQREVFSGRLDAIYTASINAERLLFCYFPTEPVITSNWVLFIKRSKLGELAFDSLKDLKNKKIGLISGYNYPVKFKKYITENSFIEEVSLETQNIAKLIRGRFDYMPAVLETTLYLARDRPALQQLAAIKHLYYFPTPLASTKFYLMFSKKTVTKAFVERFSKALLAFKKTVEYQRIIRKYQ